MEHQDSSSEPIEKFLCDLTNEKPRPFSIEELMSFTSNLEKKLGFGGFGDVYKGKLSNGVKIAVKVLKDNASEIMRKQFMAEVSTMGRTSHPNLIKLYGFCFDSNMKALVYEYMKNGSLDTLLFTDTIQIDWIKLYDIATEIANGLSYLHEHCRPRIIHYDIKPGNVLLDSNLSPKIIDFGMARHSNKDISQVEQSGFRGTSGCAAPEVGRGRQVTHKSDVYSYGMMLFEILRRKRNSMGPGWFPGEVGERVEKDELDKIIMVCGIEEKDKAKAEKLCLVALWCTQQKHLKRPDMSSVVKMLQGEISLPKPPNPFPFYDSSPESSMFGRRPLPKFSPAFNEGRPEESSRARAGDLTKITSVHSGSSSTSRPPSKIIPNDLKREICPGQNASLQKEQIQQYYSRQGSLIGGSTRTDGRGTLSHFSPVITEVPYEENDQESKTIPPNMEFQPSSTFKPRLTSNPIDPTRNGFNIDSVAISSRLLQAPFPKQTMLATDDIAENVVSTPAPTDIANATGGITQVMIEKDSATSLRQYCCDGCSTCPILRRRWHCTVCRDFDLCEACYEVLDADWLPPPHSRDHPMSAIPIEMEMEESHNFGILFDGIPKLHKQAKTEPIPRKPKNNKANASTQRERSEHLKKVYVAPKPKSSESLLESLDKRCPPGGENSVIVYTTTGGNRKPFKDSNKVRSLLHSHYIQMFERDIFTDAVSREQLKELMGYIKVPLLFVKGRLVGGADEVTNMEENGDLDILFDGIPKLHKQAETKVCCVGTSTWKPYPCQTLHILTDNAVSLECPWCVSAIPVQWQMNQEVVQWQMHQFNGSPKW